MSTDNPASAPQDGSIPVPPPVPGYTPAEDFSAPVPVPGYTPPDLTIPPVAPTFPAPDLTIPPAPGYTPAPTPPVPPTPPFAAMPPAPSAMPLPGYGQSEPAPMPTPGYGQVPPAPAFPPVPPAAPPYNPTQYAPAPYGSAPYGPGPVGGQPVLAEWTKRAYGAIVDWGPILVLAIISYFVGGGISSIFAILALAWGLYNIGYLGGQTGVTFGRRMAGTKLVREDTLKPLGAGLGIGRYFLHLIDAVICYIGFLFPLWTPKKQTIADMIAKSIVIVDNR